MAPVHFDSLRDFIVSRKQQGGIIISPNRDYYYFSYINWQSFIRYAWKAKQYTIQASKVSAGLRTKADFADYTGVAGHVIVDQPVSGPSTCTLTIDKSGYVTAHSGFLNAPVTTYLSGDSSNDVGARLMLNLESRQLLQRKTDAYGGLAKLTVTDQLYTTAEDSPLVKTIDVIKQLSIAGVYDTFTCPMELKGGFDFCRQFTKAPITFLICPWSPYISNTSFYKITAIGVKKSLSELLDLLRTDNGPYPALSMTLVALMSRAQDGYRWAIGPYVTYTPSETQAFLAGITASGNKMIQEATSGTYPIYEEENWETNPDGDKYTVKIYGDPHHACTATYTAGFVSRDGIPQPPSGETYVTLSNPATMPLMRHVTEYYCVKDRSLKWSDINSMNYDQVLAHPSVVPFNIESGEKCYMLLAHQYAELVEDSASFDLFPGWTVGIEVHDAGTSSGTASEAEWDHNGPAHYSAMPGYGPMHPSGLGSNLKFQHLCYPAIGADLSNYPYKIYYAMAKSRKTPTLISPYSAVI